MTLTIELSMEVISAQGAYKKILLLWISLVSHWIHYMEMVSLARSFQSPLLVSFANNIHYYSEAWYRKSLDGLPDALSRFFP